MTIKDLFKLLKPGTKLKLVFENGAEAQCVVEKIKRVNRQWEDPGKEAILASSLTDKKGIVCVGYYILNSNDMKIAELSEIEGGFQLKYHGSFEKGKTEEIYKYLFVD
jgi:hypothetical protein